MLPDSMHQISKQDKHQDYSWLWQAVCFLRYNSLPLHYM